MSQLLSEFWTILNSCKYLFGKYCMYLLLKPTQKGGGVSITADEETMDLVERLLTNHAMNSYCCWEDGSCMALSRYFDKDRSHLVDWVTLIVVFTVLIASLGYFASEQDHASRARPSGQDVSAPADYGAEVPGRGGKHTWHIVVRGGRSIMGAD